MPICPVSNHMDAHASAWTTFTCPAIVVERVLTPLGWGEDRDEIAGCSEKAYRGLTLEDAQKLMMFDSINELKAYASEVTICSDPCGRSDACDSDFTLGCTYFCLSWVNMLGQEVCSLAVSLDTQMWSLQRILVTHRGGRSAEPLSLCLSIPQ